MGRFCSQNTDYTLRTYNCIGLEKARAQEGMDSWRQLGFIRAISSGQIDASWHLGFKGYSEQTKEQIRLVSKLN